MAKRGNTDKNLHRNHRERVRDEFLRSGLDSFKNHEIMEFLLFYSIARQDTNELGHRLINRFGSLSGVFDASYDLLCEMDGIGERSATLIKLVSAIIRAYMDDHAELNNIVDTPESTKNYMRYKFLGEQLECVYLVCLGSNGKVIFCDKIAQGLPESVEISPAIVVKAALRSNAVMVVLAHNHPHGICNPSNRDLGTTMILLDELGRVDIRLVDHIIVAPDGVCSMREMGMISEYTGDISMR